MRHIVRRRARRISPRVITFAAIVALVVACARAASTSGTGAPAPRTSTAQPTTAPATSAGGVPAAQGGAPNQGPGGPGAGGGGFPASPPDTAAASREKMMNAVLQSIAGRENQPAESVFKNIKAFKGQQAGRLVRIMNGGFGRSLGVSCTHCHVEDHWDSEEKPTKQIAREMVAMTNAITRDYLAKIPNIKSERPIVNCGTCHRGVARPGAGGPGR